MLLVLIVTTEQHYNLWTTLEQQ